MREGALLLRNWSVWLAFFVYSMLAALAVQLVVLPYLLPELHAGGGLFVRLDSTLFHELAVAQADRITAEGWSQWSLFTLSGGFLVGIASAIYAVIVPEPWVLVPINAALHASAAFLVFRVVEVVIDHRQAALIAALPFLLYPSALGWYSQWLADGWFILGNLLFLYGWLGLGRFEAWTRDMLGLLRSAAWITSGVWLGWIARPYSSILMAAISVVFALLLTAFFVARTRASGIVWHQAALGVLVCWTMVGVVTMVASRPEPVEWLTSFEPDPLQPLGPAPPTTVAAVESAATDAGLAVGETAASPSSRARALIDQVPHVPAYIADAIRPTRTGTQYWRHIGWLPNALNQRLYSLANYRDKFRRNYVEDNETNIDMDVGFEDGIELLAYVPRAAMIGLFAPFPNRWMDDATRKGGTLMRRVAAFEMILLYIALALVPYTVWHWRKRIGTYLILLHCLIQVAIFSLIISNVGALYRFRYGFVMTLAALGLAGAFTRMCDRGSRLSRQSDVPAPTMREPATATSSASDTSLKGRRI